MIVHLVLLKVRADVPVTRIAEVFEEVGALRGEIAGIVDYSWGEYASPEGLNRGFTHGFSMSFTDAAHRDAYLPHAAHEVVKGHVLEILAGGVDGVLAFDFEA